MKRRRVVRASLASRRGSTRARADGRARGLAARAGASRPRRIAVLRGRAHPSARSRRARRARPISRRRAAPRGSAMTLLEEAMQFGGDARGDRAPISRRCISTLGDYHALAALPSSPLARRAEHAQWLDAHPTRVVAPDSVLTVALSRRRATAATSAACRFASTASVVDAVDRRSSRHRAVRLRRRRVARFHRSSPRRQTRGRGRSPPRPTRSASAG